MYTLPQNKPRCWQQTSSDSLHSADVTAFLTPCRIHFLFGICRLNFIANTACSSAQPVCASALAPNYIANTTHELSIHRTKVSELQFGDLL